jgi:hypothetical protein
MVDTQKVAISYCFIFLFIFFCAVGYIVLPTYINKAFHKSIDLPKTTVMNNTITAVSAIPTNNLFLLALAVLAAIIIFFVFGSMSMMSAY